MKLNQRWIVLDDGKYIHVLPTMDTKPHGVMSPTVKDEKGLPEVKVAGLDCLCKPKITSIDLQGRLILTHNSFLNTDKINASLSKLFTEN